MKHSIETQRDWQNDLKVKREIKVKTFESPKYKSYGCCHTPSISFSCN